MTVFSTIQEYFLLSAARATATIVPADARAAIGRQLALGRQRSEAADALWSNGHVAEGLRLAADAFDATLAAVAPFERATDRARASLLRESPLAPEPPMPEPAIAEDATAEDATAEDATAEDAESSRPSDEAASAEAQSDGTASEPMAAEAVASGNVASEELASEELASQELASQELASQELASEELAPEPVASDRAASDPLATEIAASAHQDEPLSTLDASVGEPAWAVALRRRGLSEAKTRAVLDADRSVRAKTLPSLDEEVSAAEGELFQQLVTARRHVDGMLSPASMTPGQLAWTRASRIGFAAVLACAALVGLYLLLRPPSGIEASASAQYNAEFVPGNAIDGDEASEWLLPDRRAGWVDVRILPPEHIDTLRLKNAHNRGYNDRATREYTVEIYRHGDAAGHPTKTIQGEWPRLSPRPDWTDHSVAVDDVERIRVNVRSWHRNGGGLAEIDWD